MLFVFSPIFVADTKIIYRYNFVTSLSLFYFFELSLILSSQFLQLFNILFVEFLALSFVNFCLNFSIEKNQKIKTKGCLIFLGDIERDQWHEIS